MQHAHWGGPDVGRFFCISFISRFRWCCEPCDTLWTEDLNIPSALLGDIRTPLRSSRPPCQILLVDSPLRPIGIVRVMKIVVPVLALAGLVRAVSITGCHQHGTDVYCITPSGEEVQVALDNPPAELPSEYTDCHTHGGTS